MVQVSRSRLTWVRPPSPQIAAMLVADATSTVAQHR